MSSSPWRRRSVPFWLLVATGALALAACRGDGRDRAGTAVTKDRQADPTRAAAELVDLNHASLAELEHLPGVGSAYAQAIVAGRPYANKTQLRAHLVVPLKVYEGLEAYVVARQHTSP